MIAKSEVIVEYPIIDGNGTFGIVQVPAHLGVISQKRIRTVFGQGALEETDPARMDEHFQKHGFAAQTGPFITRVEVFISEDYGRFPGIEDSGRIKVLEATINSNAAFIWSFGYRTRYLDNKGVPK